MKIAVLGGGPAGLFFASLVKQADPAHEIVVYERNKLDDTFGFGVVFSDATEAALEHADPEVTRAMARESHRWDDIEIRYGGRVLTSGGHGFSGLSRRTLLRGLLGGAAGVPLDRDVGHRVPPWRPIVLQREAVANRPVRHPRAAAPLDGARARRRTAACRKQPTRWSFTSPAACMNA